MSRSLRLPLVLLLVVSAALLLPLPFSGRLAKYGLDFAHVFVGASLAFVVLSLLNRRVYWGWARLAITTWVIATLGGIAFEKVQGLIGREASWLDAGTNALGAAAFLLVLTAKRVRGGMRAPVQMLAFLCLLVAALIPARYMFDALRQERAMPMLASFEDDMEMSRWVFLDGSGRRVHSQVTEGNSALRVRMAAGDWPGATLAWVPPDWSPYEDLVFDIHLDAGPTLELIVKIEDQGTDGSYEDRFHHEMPLSPGKHTVRIPLTDIQAGPAARQMDLAKIKTLQWFFDGLATPRTMHLDNVRLEGRLPD